VAVAKRVVALDGRRRWRASTGVQPIEATRTRVVQQEEQVAAQPDDKGHHHLEYGVRRNGRIQRIPPRLQHPKSRLRRQIVRGRHDAMTSEGYWPVLRKVRERVHPGPFCHHPPATPNERAGTSLLFREVERYSVVPAMVVRRQGRSQARERRR